MVALPVEHDEDPLDPQRILRELPGRERANFLVAYREALDGARDPAGWENLRRVLHIWSGMVIATNRPGFYEAQEAALTGVPRRRVADVDDLGFVVFAVDEAAGLVRVFDLVWTG